VRQITRELIRDPLKRQNAIDELLRIGKVEIVNEDRKSGAGRRRTILRPTPGSGNFVHFVTLSGLPENETPNHGDKTPFRAQTGWTEYGQNTDRTVTQIPDDPPLTGKSVTSNAESVTCHFYQEHQMQHRWNGSRFVCPVCDPDPEAG
jgi:hypothetical protein